MQPPNAVGPKSLRFTEPPVGCSRASPPRSTHQGLAMDTAHATSPFPATLDVDYPDRPLNRLTTFFRAFTIIPIAIVLGTVSGATHIYTGGSRRGRAPVLRRAGGGVFARP